MVVPISTADYPFASRAERWQGETGPAVTIARFDAIVDLP